MYRRAQCIKADVYVDEIILIADDSRNDWLERQNKRTGKTKLVLNREALQRAELRINARKYAASKLNPKKYGDRITHAGDPENPAQVNNQGWMLVYVDPEPSPEPSALTQRLLPGADPEQPK